MLKKLLNYCKSIFQSKNKNIDNELSVTITLKPDYQIDISLSYPEVDKMDLYSISNIAEKYAELIMYSNSSAMKHKLLAMIQDRAYSCENIKHKLFFDNICSFYEIIKQEIKNNQNNNGPLIRPISVFSNK